MGHETLKEREHADAEARRAELDKKRAVVSANPREAKLYSHSLGGVGTHAAIVIKIPQKDARPHFMTCELSLDQDGLTLIIVCPSCLLRHHRRQEDIQLTMRSWHRRFSLDPFGEGELWVNPENAADVVTLAGTIETHEVQTCPVCHLKFQIEKSRDPKERGVSVIREA
jgi:hypothetical protein